MGDELLHGRRAALRILAQGPANRFLDEEFLISQIILDQRVEQIGVRLLFVAQLEEQGRAPQPDVFLPPPTADMFIANLREAGDDAPNMGGCQAVDRVPPGFGRDQPLQQRNCIRGQDSAGV